jgi:large subunit ribosomal protein L32
MVSFGVSIFWKVFPDDEQPLLLVMAAVALGLPRIQFSIARWLPPVLGGAVLGWSAVSRTMHSFLLELFPSIVLAVPKKKVSHSRKAMRAANKGLKDKQSIPSL